MLTLTTVLGALTVVSASPVALRGPETPATHHGCGDLNFILTGLPPYHPTVIEQGYDPAMVDTALHMDMDRIKAAGYNIRMTLLGPEIPMSVLEDELSGIEWAGIGTGFGVRGAARPDLTIHFEEVLETYHEAAPNTPLFFNYSPNTTLWAIERDFPLEEDCSEKPGKDLGFNVFCDIC